jgi:hypothetical protein
MPTRVKSKALRGPQTLNDDGLSNTSVWTELAMNPGCIPMWILGAPFITLILLSRAFGGFPDDGIGDADGNSRDQPLALLT